MNDICLVRPNNKITDRSESLEVEEGITVQLNVLDENSGIRGQGKAAAMAAIGRPLNYASVAKSCKKPASLFNRIKAGCLY